MIDEAIILAGGLGTRLSSVLKDVPKPMADINGRPFLEYILKYLLDQGISHVILSVGYKYEIIRNYFKKRYLDLQIDYSIEDKPLGTGGAIKRALYYSNGEDTLILNGDTIFKIDLHKFYELHRSKKSPLSIALKLIEDTRRYGLIEIDYDFRIKGFYEKGRVIDKGLINGGIYLLNKAFFSKFEIPEIFSFEKDFLEKYYKEETYKIENSIRNLWTYTPKCEYYQFIKKLGLLIKELSELSLVTKENLHSFLLSQLLMIHLP